MRPSILDPLFADITALPKVGPKVGALFAKVLGRVASGTSARVIDLLLQPPTTYLDRRHKVQVSQATNGLMATLELVVEHHQFAPDYSKKAPSRIICSDQSGEITLVFFRSKRVWLERAYPVGETVTVSGVVDWYHGRPSMVHPDLLGTGEDAVPDLVEPVYPLTAGLMAKTVRNAVSTALERVPDLPEWQGPHSANGATWPGFKQSLITLHRPQAPEDAAPEAPPRSRLAYDELLSGQLSLALVRDRLRAVPGRAFAGDGRISTRLRQAIPYLLTGAQERAIREISTDMTKPERMIRLLQGDVGSGKTIVALFAAAQAAEAGAQTAIMAPTELLARQHMASMEPLAAQCGLTIRFLSGKISATERRNTLAELASGSCSIVVGTHALFQQDVAFKDLGLVVVDEQHRFGVHQRMALTAKGKAPDLLVTTATPIPRTLVLAAYGDMDSSRLDEKPVGRKPIKTITLPTERLDDLVSRIASAIATGAKVYWVCPLVEQSDLVELVSADTRHKMLANTFGNAVGLIHGRMSSEEKDAAMDAFRTGKTSVLVATTVIEVGVDVPDATIIVIEHAERFGLAQLHQLRGRVGRGSEASTCVLLFQGPLGETAEKRLQTMRDTEDGFLIAEQDLKLRGEGDLLGTRQAGLANYRLADFSAHANMLERARDDARLVVATDPELATERGRALRTLLYLFSRDDAVRLLKAG